jgi:RND family efflux transporter MFP subunit
MQIITFLMKIKTFFTKKKIIWTLVILLVIFGIWFIFGRQSANSTVQTGMVKVQDIEKTVLTTGQVVSSTDLDLSFASSGIVKKVFVKEGDIVQAGQLLAEEDTSSLLAELRSAEAGLIIAKQQAISSKDNVENVTAQQDALVESAYRTLLSSGLIAVPTSDSYTATAPIISGSYDGPEGVYKIVIDKENITDTDYQLRTYNLERIASVIIKENEPTKLGTHGLYVSFSDELENYLDTQWSVLIPNIKSASYLANYNAYEQALKARDTAIANAKASVGADTSSVSDAEIAQAQANIDNINAQIRNARIVAPANGTITQVDVKVGELAQALQGVIKLLNIGELHTEALVSEADIASVSLGQSIDNTFDALGPDKHFTTTVLTINPASTVISGVVNYKVTGSLENIPEVKPGMTVNMTIKVAEKKNVLVVPTSAIINKNGKNIVRVIDDTKKKTYTEKEVTVGLNADGGLTEIIYGLSEGQEVVTYIK